jgi:hypothetical protein
MGTPEYMSPEQTEGAALVDHRTDIWAMGVILYWALTGKNPFMGPTMAATLMNVSMREAPPLQQVAPGLPPQLVHVVERCVRKNPDERWSSCTELRQALEPFEDLHGRFFVPYASRSAGMAAAMPAGGLDTRSPPPPGATVASSGPPPSQGQQGQQGQQGMMALGRTPSGGETFSSELSGAPSHGQPTLAGGFSGGNFDEDYGRPQSNMGGGIGGIVAIAVVGVALVGGGGYFIWAQATQGDRIADVSTPPEKSEESGEVKAEEEERKDVPAAKTDVPPAKAEKLDAGVAGAEGAAAEAGAAEAGAEAEAGEADEGAEEAGEADDGAEEAGGEEGGAAEGGANNSGPAKKGTSGAKKGTSGAKKGGGSGGGAAGGDTAGGDKSGTDKSGTDKSGGGKSGGDKGGGKSLTPIKPPRDDKKAGDGEKKAGGGKKKKKKKKTAAAE